MSETQSVEQTGMSAPSRLERVVVPVDGSELAERAIGVAEHVAERTGASLRLLTVVPRLSDGQAPSDVPSSAEVVQDPDPAQAIVDAVAAPDALLAMATHGRGRVGEMVLGSVAEAVLRRHDRPMILVGPQGGEGDPTIRRVMACVDGSRTSEAILPVAERWSRELGVPLEIVQVIPTDIDARLAKAGVRSGDVLESSYVHGLARRIGGGTDWEVLRDDDPVEAILGYAEPGTLLAVATHGRGGVRRLVMGSVAMRLAHRSAHPMLVLRPGAVGEG